MSSIISLVAVICYVLCFLSKALVMSFDNKKSDYKEDGISVDVKYPVKHVLSRELQVLLNFMCYMHIIFALFLHYNCKCFYGIVVQLYFEKITELTVGRSDSILFKEALLSLATDSSLHPLVPYFTYFIADEVIMMPIIVDVAYVANSYSFWSHFFP